MTTSSKQKEEEGTWGTSGGLQRYYIILGLGLLLIVFVGVASLCFLVLSGPIMHGAGIVVLLRWISVVLLLLVTTGVPEEALYPLFAAAVAVAAVGTGTPFRYCTCCMACCTPCCTRAASFPGMCIAVDTCCLLPCCSCLPYRHSSFGLVVVDAAFAAVAVAVEYCCCCCCCLCYYYCYYCYCYYCCLRKLVWS